MERKKVFEIMLFGMAVQALITAGLGLFFNINLGYEGQVICSLIFISVSSLIKSKKK